MSNRSNEAKATTSHRHRRRSRHRAAFAGAALFMVAAAPGADASSMPPVTDDVVTLRTLMAEPAAPVALVVGDQIDEHDEYSTFAVTYESGGLTISGLLHVPVGDGPFPAVVVVHGFVDRSTYTSGSELAREQDALAAANYVVLATDLRGHAGSDPDPADGFDLDMGATRDVISAVRSLTSSEAAPVDPARVGVLGHSLGGLVALNAMVVAPDEMAAVVALAPASSTVWDNIGAFMSPGDPVYESIVGPHGTPTENPVFWADVSPVTFAAQSTAPLLIIQGTADDAVDPAWAAATVASWSAAGATAELVTIEGADHVMDPHWEEANRLTLSFFDNELS